MQVVKNVYSSASQMPPLACDMDGLMLGLEEEVIAGLEKKMIAGLEEKVIAVMCFWILNQSVHCPCM